MSHVVVVQRWEESERGWGVRPDGWTLYLSMSDHTEHLKSFSEKQEEDYRATQRVPDCYSRPSGNPYPMDIDQETYDKLAADPNRFIWGPGNSPPR